TLLGWLAKEKPWLIALAVSVWLPIFELRSPVNWGVFIVIVPALIGSFLGFSFSGKVIRSP
ncbi:MAG TPA: hypothetical protein VJ508_06700, partial [Saprospiraceae bacterium]|nr:hypothetical protein [Saprospiraceae bacterium]